MTDKKVDSDTFIKECVREYLTLHNVCNDDFQIVRHAYQKPRLAPEKAKFSLSHSGDYTLVSVSQKEVGADIQKHVDCNRDIIAKRFFNPKEQNCDKNTFFDLWTAKEAYIKANQTDFAKGLKTLIQKEDITLINLIANYSIAIKSHDKDILIVLK
ncbi:MAG: 4'-phosphopantetheinyl transferase family protein [Bacillota bacterium]